MGEKQAIRNIHKTTYNVRNILVLNFYIVLIAA